MRVLFLADAVFADLPGGSRVVARELARGLAKRGHDVSFLVARQSAETPVDEVSNNVHIVRYSGAGKAADFVRAGRAACSRLWSEKPFDIVHTHFAYAALGPLQVVPRSVPHVRSFYGPWDEEGWVEDKARLNAMGSASLRRQVNTIKYTIKRQVRHQVEATNLRRSSSVIVLSDQSRGEVDVFGYPTAKIKKIAGGVDIDRFQPVPDRDAVRRSLGLPTDRFIMFSVRRLAPRMGLDNLIQAIPSVIKKHPDALLLIGGKGPEKERLQGLIETLGLQNNVRLVGFIPDDQLASYYQAANVFVLPTMALEGFGLVTVEALSCGVPVIGTPIGATPEILGGLDSRLVTKGAEAQQLADGILSFAGSDWSKELTQQRLRDYVLKHYTWDNHVDQVEAIYQEMLAKAS